MSGTIERVRLDALKGRRVDGPLVVYGVNDGEDLALPAPLGCAAPSEIAGRSTRAMAIAGRAEAPAPGGVRRHVAMACSWPAAPVLACRVRLEASGPHPPGPPHRGGGAGLGGGAALLAPSARGCWALW
ncbi:MAG: hypothetical protein IPN77_30475 [Sandaracinaceae bacterium]|nr:hypothetical protein [Sandaracinaceae bacterium]